MLREGYVRILALLKDARSSGASGMRGSWQEDPQKTVFPLGGNSSWVVASGNFHLPLKLAMVDLHGNDSDRLARR